MTEPAPRTPLRELAALFLRLGATSFGGPAAHIAMLEVEVVERRGWLCKEAFLDLLGATQLIPGPNSTELVIHVGYLRAGLPGLVVAGLCVITPAVAAGQLTPGPVFSTATFVGWLLDGHRGALVATVGIFLPAFVLVALSGPLVPRIRESKAAGAFLDGVNVASLALMGVVAVQLARAAVVDPASALLAAAAALGLLCYRLEPTGLILAGALAGVFVRGL